MIRLGAISMAQKTASLASLIAWLMPEVKTLRWQYSLGHPLERCGWRQILAVISKECSSRDGR
jgi:hypothetical protein